MRVLLRRDGLFDVRNRRETLGFPARFGVGDLNGPNGFRIDGIDVGDNLGRSLGWAGDVNGDGVPDVLLGVQLGDPGGRRSAGETYVVYGQPGGFGAVIELNDINGTNGFRMDGIDALDVSGVSVAGAGDVNGDGVDDVLVGAFFGDPEGRKDAGECYVVFGQKGGLGPVVYLGDLDGSNGFRIDGIRAGDGLGGSVSRAGDFNDDGVGDLILGAKNADPEGRNAAGEAYVIYGNSGGFGSVFSLNKLNETTGFRISGLEAGDFLGNSVSFAGDMNGDGVDDVIVGAMGANPLGIENSGESYVLFGKKGGSGATIDLNFLNGTNGVRIRGVNSFDHSGSALGEAGDVNGDGVGDVIIGASSADPGGLSGAGEGYVVFGRLGGLGASFDLGDLNGHNGFRIAGLGAGDGLGVSVGRAGDLNGDGFSDVVVGAEYSDPLGINDAGEAYVVFGKKHFLDPVISIDSFNGENGFRIHGNGVEDHLGVSVGFAGDLDFDGVDDLIVGAKYASPDGVSSAGASYVIFGQAQVVSASSSTSASLINGILSSTIAYSNVSTASNVSTTVFGIASTESVFSVDEDNGYVAIVTAVVGGVLVLLVGIVLIVLVRKSLRRYLAGEQNRADGYVVHENDLPEESVL